MSITKQTPRFRRHNAYSPWSRKWPSGTRIVKMAPVYGNTSSGGMCLSNVIMIGALLERLFAQPVRQYNICLILLPASQYS